MKRSSFVLSTFGAALAAGLPFASAAAALVGKQTTQGDLFAALPRPESGDWLRMTMGSGVPYGKQIGFGTEVQRDGTRLAFVETQIGIASLACNPNTTRKTYLTTPHFGALVTPYPVLATVARSGNIVTRWADVAGGQTRSASDAHLRLLDEAYLYDARSLTIESVEKETLHVAGRARETTRVTARFGRAARAGQLETVELWHAPDVPFGVARYRATLSDLDPFSLSLDKYGARFKTYLDVSLDAVRSMTEGGAAGVLNG